MRFSGFIGMGVLILLFQNCMPNHAPILDESKEKSLHEKSVFAKQDSGIPDKLELQQPKLIHFNFVCPLQQGQKDLLQSQELKVVIQEFNYDSQSTTTICEVYGVKKQIQDTRTVDLSACLDTPSALATHLDLYLVEEDVHENYAENRINLETTPAALGGYSLAYVNMSALQQPTACDEVGAPLMVQLPEEEGAPSGSNSLELTAPSAGVLFNLLGSQAYPIAHNKEQVSWFKHSEGENYFLTKPNKEGLVLGIDELFADTTRGPDAKEAKHGFAALEKFDDNKDQIIDESDVIYHELRLWKDLNLDGEAQENELASLSEKGVAALDLRYDARFSERDMYGNITRFKSVILTQDGRYGLIFDLNLRLIHPDPSESHETLSNP